MTRILRNRPLLTSGLDYCREFKENNSDAAFQAILTDYLQSDTWPVVGGTYSSPMKNDSYMHMVGQKNWTIFESL